MKIYYVDQGNNQGLLIATHNDDQNIDPSIYGDNVKVFTISDINDLVRVGPSPPNGEFDNRPIQVGSDVTDPEDVLKNAKLNAIKIILSAITKVANTLTESYPEHEMLSWGTKEAAANDYLAGKDLTNTQKTMLEAEQSTGNYTSLEELCNAVVNKAATFMKVSGALAGIRSSYSTEINDAPSEDKINEILTDFQTRLSTVSSLFSSNS
jgi:hypothetical protein